MPTFQSRPGRWVRYNATPGAHARRSAARTAAAIAGPSPAYPPSAPLHGDWVGGCIHGHTVIVRLMQDSRHRCDQWAAEIDGTVVAEAIGLTALLDMLRGRYPRRASLREMATMQTE